MRYGTLQDHVGRDKQGAIEAVDELGMDGLELVIPDGIHGVGPDGMGLQREHRPVEHDEIWSPDDRATLVELADEHGVSLPSICPSFLNMRAGLTSADPEERIAVRERLSDLIVAAEDIGAAVILVPFFMDAEIESTEQRERVAEEIAALGDEAGTAGVTLAIENTLDATANRELLDAIDHPAAAIYYDVANVTSFGYDPATELRELGDAVAQIHFKDGHGGGSDAMLGEGSVDFDGVAGAIDDIGYDDWIVIETKYDDPIDSMRQNFEFARTLVE